MILPANLLEKVFHTFDYRSLDNSSVCILGGTGFIGTWLVSAINYLNCHHRSQIDLTIYTRDRPSALKKFSPQEFPNLKVVEFDFLTGIRDLGEFDFFVNGSTPTSSKPHGDSKHIFYHPTVNAVESIIYSARKSRSLTRVVNLSSGAVYGHQSLSVPNQLEEDSVAFTEELDDYSLAKIKSETTLTQARQLKTLKSVSPRLFAFFGPGLPLDRHFAIGNFVQDGLNGQPIRIMGNPETKRSYMFPTDLTSWLLTALVNPIEGNFNVGSEIGISMFELATLVSGLTSSKGVEMLNRLEPASNYVPSTTNFRQTFRVDQSVALSEGLGWWIDWLKNQR